MSADPTPRLTYPVTRKGDDVDTYFGTSVPDPYRHLEDPAAVETQQWVKAQNEVTQQVLKACPDKSALEARLKEVYNYERVSCPFRRGEMYFFFRNSGLQNQSVLYKQHGLDGKPEVLLDPNTLEADGTAALGSYSFTKSGSLLAYGVARSGSDWNTIHVMRVSDGGVLSDKIEWVKFSGISWTHDEKGFFYSRYPTPREFSAPAQDATVADGTATAAAQQADPNYKRGTETSSVKNHQVFYHRVGTDQCSDLLVHSVPSQPEWTLGARVTEDGKFIVLTLSESCDTKNRLFIQPLGEQGEYDPALEEKRVKLIDRFEAEFGYVDNDANTFVFRTNHQAGRYKLISMDISSGASVGLTPERWTTIIPEHPKDVLQDVDVLGGGKYFLASYSRDVKDELSLLSRQGQTLIEKFDMPDVGCVGGLATRKEDNNFFFSFTSFLYPGSIFHVKLNDNDNASAAPAVSQSLWKQITVPGFDASLFTTEQVWYNSHDGTRIPMFIVHRKDLQKDGQNATWLYGYGGFNISLSPSFSVARLVWLSHFNGVFACPNIRGGGEYGEDWYKAGVLMKKKNCFDDFIAAAEYLIQQKYTSPNKLAINGGSNGGLLVAACLNQRPDLFGAVIGQVGVLDMLKYDQWTIGYAWASDYGRSRESEEMFKYLLSYSPVHNVQADPARPYPAVLLCTADHDDRVCALHSYKFIATLQSTLGSMPTQRAPLVIRIETKAGHGAGVPLSKRIVEQADIIAFMAKMLGAKGKF